MITSAALQESWTQKEGFRIRNRDSKILVQMYRQNNINKNALLIGSMALVASCSQDAEAKRQPQLKERPNVLFILADDMTHEAIHALGNEEVITPNLDRLVAGGTAFTNAYNMGGWHGAISVASRSMLLTGRYIWHSKQMQDAGYASLFEKQESWPQIMKRNGYCTYMTGKWHIDHIKPEQVYDKAESVCLGGMPGAHNSQYNRPLSENDNSWLPWDESKGGYWKGGKHWSELYADNIIRYLGSRKDREDPFFIYAAFNAPHDPRQSPKEYVDMYDADKIKVPEDFSPEHPLKELMGCPTTSRDEKIAPFPRTEYAVRKHRQEYYAIITHLDAQIGRILDKLEETGLDKNTIVVFAADNGLGCGHHGLMGKQSMYDHSMNVPLIFYGAGIPAGQRSDALVYMQDLIPTVYDMSGITKPEGVEFRSLKKVIGKPSSEHRDAIYGTFTNINQRMIRDGRYKLFFIPKAKTVYLFDLKNDPYEMHNLYGDKKYDSIVRKLAQEYVQLAKNAGDPLDLAEYYPEIFN